MKKHPDNEPKKETVDPVIVPESEPIVEVEPIVEEEPIIEAELNMMPRPMEKPVLESDCPSCGFKDSVKAGPFKLAHTFQDKDATEWHCHHVLYFEYLCAECAYRWKSKETPDSVSCYCGFPFEGN